MRQMMTYTLAVFCTFCATCQVRADSANPTPRLLDAPDDATLVFLCELGPPPYAMTDGNQEELSDRWQEALQIRAWIQAIWTDSKPA